MKTPIEVFLAVAGIGGMLGMTGDQLRTRLPANCPLELKDEIRRHKTALLVLLRLNFLVIRSDTLKTIVFWTPDETTKDSLAAAGADYGSIYSASELEQLVQKRVTAGELPVFHASKQRFGGKLTEL